MLAACGTCSTLKLAVNLVFRQVSAIPVVARVAAEDPTGPSKRTGRKPFQVRVTRHSSYACKDAGRNSVMQLEMTNRVMPDQSRQGLPVIRKCCCAGPRGCTSPSAPAARG